MVTHFNLNTFYSEQTRRSEIISQTCRSVSFIPCVTRTWAWTGKEIDQFTPLHTCAFTPRSYVVIGSGTSDVSWNDLNRDRSDVSRNRSDVSRDRSDLIRDRRDVSRDRSDVSRDRSDISRDRRDVSRDRNAKLKWTGLFQTICFDQEKDTLYKGQKNAKLQRNGKLSRRPFLLNCRPVIWIIISDGQQCRWRWRVSADSLKKWSSEVWPDKDLSFSSKICSQPSSLLTVYLLLSAPVTVLKTSPSANLKTVTVLPLAWGWRSSTSSRALCFRISTGRSRVSCWSWGYSNWKARSASYLPICALALVYGVWGQTT